MAERLERVVSRRRLLAAAAAGTAVATAGCLGDSEDAPDPVALDGGQACDSCDMQIDVHPGPAGQAYYLDDPPADLPDREDGAAYFCSSQCTYGYTLEREQRGVEPAGVYATDYSAVDWQVFDDDGVAVISAHLDATAFADATELTYVVDSDVEGAMGASLVGFSDGDDAESFADEHGGTLLDHGDVTLETLAAL